MDIIDFHTHPGYNSTKHFGINMTPELFVAELKRAGITKACGSALDLELLATNRNDFNVIKKMNQIAWQYHEEFPDFIVPGIHIHPDFVEQSAVEIDEYSKKGVRR